MPKGDRAKMKSKRGGFIPFSHLGGPVSQCKSSFSIPASLSQPTKFPLFQTGPHEVQADLQLLGILPILPLLAPKRWDYRCAHQIAFLNHIKYSLLNKWHSSAWGTHSHKPQGQSKGDNIAIRTILPACLPACPARPAWH